MNIGPPLRSRLTSRSRFWQVRVATPSVRLRSWRGNKERSGMTSNALTILTAFALIAFCNVAAAQDQAQIEAGEQLYDEHCASCHGEKLRTTGSAADLKEMRAEDRPRFDRAMMEGRGQMPSWQGVLNEEEMNQMWAYIRSHAK